jgi:hypothetical protein
MLDHFWLGGPGVQQNNFRCYRCRSIHRGAGIGGRPTPQVLTYVNGGWTSARFSGVDFPRGQITLRYRLLAEVHWRRRRVCGGGRAGIVLAQRKSIAFLPSYRSSVLRRRHADSLLRPPICNRADDLEVSLTTA